MTTFPDTVRNKKILRLRGKKSFGLIAKDLGLTRNIVAGVCFRHDHPPELRFRSPNSHGCNKIGTGYTGRGKDPKKMLPGGRRKQYSAEDCPL